MPNPNFDNVIPFNPTANAPFARRRSVELGPVDLQRFGPRPFPTQLAGLGEGAAISFKPLLVAAAIIAVLVFANKR